jgi:hypothetical protein
MELNQRNTYNKLYNIKWSKNFIKNIYNSESLEVFLYFCTFKISENIEKQYICQIKTQMWSTKLECTFDTKYINFLLFYIQNILFIIILFVHNYL